MALVVRGIFKLVAVIVIAGGIGGGVGVGLSKLSGDSGGGAAPAPAAKQSATTSGGSSSKSPPPPPASEQAGGVSVHVVDAVFHPAESPSGLRRHRARLTVRVQVTNRGTSVVTPERPSMFVGSAETKTDPNADGPGTSLGTLQPGKAVAVTLRFEIAGAVTTQLRSQLRARVVVAGRSRDTLVTIGSPATAHN
ncbi:MAG TPA: hypothetical protein VHZ75_09905 [Solirubrobacteraceae bacterium]|jgi:hypothetical protein|nr:hypothetical protein [Solirubrobacteraceae bacterium]